MRVVAWALGLLATVTTAYHTKEAHLFSDDGTKLCIRGASWFGFETQDFVINGLHAHPMDFYVKLLANEGINALRVPVSAEWLLYNEGLYPYEGFVAADPDNQHKTSLQILDHLFDKASGSNILILLDMHRLHKEYISELWYSPYDGTFTEDDYFAAWYKLLDRYGNHSALLGIDLLNEPHGRATWGDDVPSTDWRRFAEHALDTLEKRYPGNRWIYLVEGINWGVDLSRAGDTPVRPPASAKDRVIYSAHTYGKSVVASTDPDNVAVLEDGWYRNFGYLRDRGLQVIVGEWGGKVYLDAQWMNHFADYVIEHDMRDNFFWSLGPNSGDVAGYLLDDWTTIDDFKRVVVSRICAVPVPTPWKTLSTNTTRLRGR